MAAGPLSEGRSAEDARRHGPDPGLVALLSLQLLLLAFFILLTVLSRYELDRVHRVVESVAGTFGVRVSQSAPQPVTTGGLGFYDAMRPIAEQLRRVAAMTLPVKVEIALRRDGELRVEIPYDALFSAGDASPRSTLRPLFAAIARALRGRRFETHYWALDASTRPVAFRGGDRSEEAERDLAIRRAAAVVRSLVTLGLPDERLAAGLLDDDDRALRLTVRPLAEGARR